MADISIILCYTSNSAELHLISVLHLDLIKLEIYSYPKINYANLIWKDQTISMDPDHS